MLVPDLPLAALDLPWAYVGLGPGQELVPYFWALVTFVGAAVVAVVQWPVVRLRRALFRRRDRSANPGNGEPAAGGGDGSP